MKIRWRTSVPITSRPRTSTTTPSKAGSSFVPYWPSEFLMRLRQLPRMRRLLLHLVVGEIEGGLGVRVVGELGEEVAVGGLGVGVAACVELGLAEGVLRHRGIGVEGDSLTEFRDGGVELPFSSISGAQTEMGARIVWNKCDQFLVEGDGL